jgi:hypothetical protein
LRWTQRDAQRALEAWRASGLRLPAWCRQEGVGYERVRRWRRQLDATLARRRKAPAVFPVHVLEQALTPEARDFELELSGGRRLRVPPHFDEASLARLLRALEARA